MKKQERAALEAVAREFSATWEQGNGLSEATLIVAGKRVAVDIAALKWRGTGPRSAAKPRLRFDQVVIRLMDRLQAAFAETVPVGTTVLLTVTAPIRLASKTAAALEDKIQTLFEWRSPGRDEKATIHGNRVQIRVLRGGSKRAPKMIGFVHNSDTDPLLLLDMARQWLELASAEAGRSAPRPAGDRWLVVISAGESSGLEAHRYIHAQLGMATGFKKVLLVFGDGRVGTVTG